MTTTKRVLITGCSTGIGRAAAVELTKRGYEVVATARQVETLDGLDVAERLALDVTSQASVDEARGRAGRVDVLVNNAGFGLEGAVESVPLDDVRRVFETNVIGASRMIQAFVPAMRERGDGVVVNVSSVAGVVAAPLSGYYSASKHALEAISEALHLEVGHFGVRVLIIEPGSIVTEFGNNATDHRQTPGPYRELHDLWELAFGRLVGGGEAPGPELVAAVIAEALESVAAGKKQLRWPVGDDAQLVCTTREAMGYDDFEAQMRQVLQLDW